MIGSASSQAAEAVSTPAKPTIAYEYDSRTEVKSSVPVRITKIVDTTAILSDKGEIYALTGLDIPDDNVTAEKTQKRLIELTEGKKCTLYQTRSEKVGRLNRLNQILGHLTCGKDEAWIQGTLIAEGLARVRTTPENRVHTDKMLKLEQAARTKKLGLWALGMNTPYTADNASQYLNRFGIVEGKVYATAQNKNAIFLNFTTDWKTDFSIGIPPTLRKDFSKERIDVLSLRGKTVRVRGWIRNYNGPYIELDHIDQLEILDGGKPNQKPLEPVAGGAPADEPASPSDQAADVINTLMGRTTSQNPTGTQKLMRTLSGQSAPSEQDEKTLMPPEEPQTPIVEKPKLAPARGSSNP